MKLSKKIPLALLLSLVINAPFAVGEFLTRDTSGPRAYFPLKLFIGLWIEMAVFLYVLMSVIHTFRNGSANEKRIRLAAQVLILAIFAWAWVTLIIDQWPCFFLGGSGC